MRCDILFLTHFTHDKYENFYFEVVRAEVPLRWSDPSQRLFPEAKGY